jgi:hypothetical protein
MEDARPIARNDSLADAAQQSTSEQRLTDAAQQSTSERRLSDAESLIDPNPLPVSTRGPVPDRPNPVNLAQQTQQQQQPGLELARRNTNMTISDSGLIPVDSSMPGAALANLPPQDLSIDNHSSFYVQKQFCAGATDVINGGIGVKRAKKPVCTPLLGAIGKLTNLAVLGFFCNSRCCQMYTLFV